MTTEHIMMDTVYQFGLDSIKTCIELANTETYLSKLYIMMSGLEEIPYIEFEENIDNKMYVYKINNVCNVKELECILQLFEIFGIHYEIEYNYIILHTVM